MAWTEQINSGKDKGKYRGRYRDRDGRKQTVGGGPFTHKAEALRKAGAKEEEQRQQGAISPDAGKITYGAWYQRWIDSHMVETSTRRQYKSTARLHVLPYWEDTPLGEIKMTEGKTWVNILQADPAAKADTQHARKKQDWDKPGPRSPWTIRIAVQMIVASLNAAIPPHDNKLRTNPLAKLKWPTLPECPDRYLTPYEVDRIGHFMSHPIHRLILDVDVTTGLRAGEIGGLHVSRIDFRRGGIYVVEQFDQHENVMKAYPKDKERRWVPLSSDVVPRLQSHVESLPKVSDCGIPHVSGRCPGGALVFAGPRRSPFKSGEWLQGPFAKALDLAKIDGRVRFHDLRHTYASWLIQDGVSFAELARVMGHSSWEVSRRYAHLAPEGYDTVRAAVTSKLGARPGAEGSVAVCREEDSAISEKAS